MTIAQTGLPTPKWASALQTPKEVKLPKSILLYGMPGTRKTSVSASIGQVPKFGKILFIDIDQGAEVLAQREEFANVNVLTINSLESGAFAKLNAVIEDITTIDYGYSAVVLDTLDVAQDVAEKHFKAKYASSSTSGKKDGFAIWGDLGEWTDEIVRKLHNSTFFTAVITAHAKEQTSESGAYRILPKLSGSSKDAIAAIPSIVGYLEHTSHPETGERHMVATVGESEKLVTKNRYGLPNQIIDLTLPSLYALIEKNTTSKTTNPAAPAAK